MYFKIPIIAYNSSAIPFTLGNSGILVNKKNYLEIAELIEIVSEDSKLRNQIIKSQEERLNYFRRDNVEKQMKTIIEKAISQQGT
jgi:glycosyltransferase involved in cell wall biosynthesis